jgi:hypothetical protein
MKYLSAVTDVAMVQITADVYAGLVYNLYTNLLNKKMLIIMLVHNF